MKLYFVVNGIFPNKKAYGIHIAKMCEAFVEKGVELELVIPYTHATRKNIQEFYGLRIDISVRVLPALPLYHTGRLWFFLSSLSFMLSSTFYLWYQKLFGKKAMIYTVDLSTFSFANLVISGMPVYIEVHDAKPKNIASRIFFARVAGVIVTNPYIKEQLQKTFGTPQSKFRIEQNGVDASWFQKNIPKNEARTRVGIAQDGNVALYMGRFYEWKNLGILAETAVLSPDIEWYVVGGSQVQFKKVTGISSLPENLHIAGECPTTDVPLWLRAADTLLILGTLKTRQSSHYTTPMKIYEYMAMERPIVASGTPALKSNIKGEALFYVPDDPENLVEQTRKAIEGGAEVEHMIQKAHSTAQTHTWAKRAERIRTFFIFD